MELVVDRESLVAELRKYGVDWLAPSDAVGGEAIEPSLLVASLAAHDDSRLRAALTGLFILRPEISAVLTSALHELNPEARNELMARYMAAVYLQRLWRTRLGLHLGEFLLLPDLYSKTMSLPGPDESYGKAGLYALAEWHQKHSTVAFNRLAEYNSQIHHVFALAKLRAQTHESAIAG